MLVIRDQKQRHMLTDRLGSSTRGPVNSLRFLHNDWKIVLIYIVKHRLVPYTYFQKYYERDICSKSTESYFHIAVHFSYVESHVYYDIKYICYFV